MQKLLKDTNMIKSYTFKVYNRNKCIITTEVIDEYKTYYNRVSDWICSNLLTLRIGDIANSLKDIKGEDVKYIKLPLSEEWRDKPLYFIFKDYPTNDGNNLIYEYIRLLNIDNYKNNILGISETYYNRQGYFKLVMSNYRSKLSNLDIDIKRRRIDEFSTSEEKESQVIYEINNYNLHKIEDWENMLIYLQDKEDVDESTINRYKILKEYFTENSDIIINKLYEYQINNLQKFGGCKMKNGASFNIQLRSFKLVQKENSLGYILKLPLNKKFFDIDLWGNRQILKGDKNNYNEKVDIINNHTESVNFKIINNELFITFGCNVNFNKSISKYNKVVGLDVNLKHAYIVSSEKDNGKIKGYVNIYKHLLQEDEFTKLLNKDELHFFQEMSKNINFCPLELEYLLSRNVDNGYSKHEQVFTDVLYKLQKKLKNLKGEDKMQYQYVCCVNKLRQQYSAYFKLKETYTKKQQEYDLTFYNENTENKDTIDVFSKTEIANSIRQKMNNIQNTINYCGKNIIVYMYKLFERNNFDTIALEHLESSNFKRIQFLPSINSLLNYHKIVNTTLEEAKAKEKVGNLITSGYYNFIFDNNGKIIDATFSDKGLFYLKKSLFFNQVIKTLHFASIKDEVILLSNNGKISTVLVPAEYSSQMDSEKHVIYYIKNNNGKLVTVNKKRVRKTQENYINGLNADFNAANNIKYFVENENWRNIFCKQPKNYNKIGGYGLPQLESTKKGAHNVLLQLKKIGACNELSI